MSPGFLAQTLTYEEVGNVMGRYREVNAISRLIIESLTGLTEADVAGALSFIK